MRSTAASLNDRSLVASRWAVSGYFALSGILFANWVSRIPDVKAGLGISEAQLGFALLAGPVGLMLALPFSGAIVSRLGSRTTTFVAAAAFAVLNALPAFAPNVWLMALVFAITGAAHATTDIAMNAQAILVQQRFSRSIMTTFHAMWSLGALFGALTGGVAIGAGLPPHTHLAIVAAVGVVAALGLSRWLMPDAGKHTTGPALALPGPALLGIGLVGVGSSIAEGAAGDWSTLFMQTELLANPALAPWGYAGFAAAMAVGRLSGDRLNDRFGPVAMLRVAGALVLGGTLVAITSSVWWAGVIGFSLVGLGASVVIPLVFAAAGRTRPDDPSMALAAVATMGYGGFLLGAPIIGSVAEALSLRWALLLVAFAGLLIASLASHARPQ